MKIPRAATMTLCLAAGVGVSLAWRQADLGKKPQTEVVETTTISPTQSPRSRKLHLESLWSQRRATFNAAEAAPRVLAAIATGKWDDASKKEMVSLLIADPSFINTIWDKSDPATRNAMMAQLIKEVIKDNPSTALHILDEGKFDFSQIPGIGDLLNQTVYYGRSPIDTLDAAKRNKHKLGQYVFDEMLWGAANHEEVARAILNDAVLDGVYPKGELTNACRTVMREDGVLPPGVENLEAAKAFLTKKAAQDQTTGWLTEGKPLTAEELKTMDDGGVFAAMYKKLWDEGKNLDASQLELLAAAGRGEEQRRALELMIEGGRPKDALRLLDEIKEMPATKPKRDQLISAVATSIYEAGGDVGEACRIMEGIADDPVYWKSMTEVLKTWVIDDPVAGRAYLEQVTDPELRKSLEEALTKTSLDP